MRLRFKQNQFIISASLISALGASRWAFAEPACVGRHESDCPSWCSRASTSVERAICKTESLLTLEDELKVYYKRASVGPARETTIAEQKAWIAERERCGQEETADTIRACVKRRYKEREKALLALVFSELDRASERDFAKLDLKTYVDDKNGFEVRYPSAWAVKPKKNGLVAFGPTLKLGVDRSKRKASDCVLRDDSRTEADMRREPKEIGGLKFTHYAVGDVGMGHWDRTDTYLAFSNGRCYAVTMDSKGVNCGVYGGGTREADCEIEQHHPTAVDELTIGTLRFL